MVPELTASSGARSGRRPPSPRPLIANVAAAVRRIVYAEAAQALQRRGAIGAWRVAADYRFAIGNRGEQRVSVRNRLVAGDPDTPRGTGRRRDRDRVSGRAEHVRTIAFALLMGSGLVCYSLACL